MHITSTVRTRFLLLFLVLAMLGSAVSVAAQNKQLTKVTWGVDSFLTTLPQRIADELGYYEEEGVDIELQVSALGITSMDSIIAGQTDLGNGAHWALTTRLMRHNIGLGGFILAWRPPVELMVAPGIESLEDLKGKKVATIAGSLWDWYVHKALEAGGLSRNDATLLNFGSPVDYLAAAARRDVDAAWFWEANLERAKEILGPRGWKSIATRYDVAPPAAVDGHGPLPISIRAAQEKPEAIAGALRAYKRASDWCMENLDDCARMANRLLSVPVDEAKAILPDMGYYVGFPKEYVDLMKEMKEFALDQGYIKPEEDFDFDDRVVVEPLRLAFPDAIDF